MSVVMWIFEDVCACGCVCTCMWKCTHFISFHIAIVLSVKDQGSERKFTLNFCVSES